MKKKRKHLRVKFLERHLEFFKRQLMLLKKHAKSRKGV